MVQPYINFKGQANEAIHFYEKVFGGTDKKVMKYSDMPPNPAHPTPDEIKEWVTHGEMTICGTPFNFSDIQNEAATNGMISLAVKFDSPEEAISVYHKLKEGGEVLMELEPQFFARQYASIRDQYGVEWQLICE